jgi:integrase
LRRPRSASVGRQRERLAKRLEQLKKQHGWGDLTDEEYVAKRDEVKAALAALPAGDRIASFDAFRAQVLALPEAIAVASPARREELCQLVVERVVVHDRVIERIDWTPAARPFLEKRERVCPQGDSNP